MNYAARSIFVTSLICGAAALAMPAAAQLSSQGTGNCRVGLFVATRDGRVGTVERAQGNSCHVRFADGSEDYFQQWMLRPAGSGGGRQAPGRGRAPAAAAGSGGGSGGGAVPAGSYQCFGGQAGNMRITLQGNRWNDFYAELLPDGRVGLSSRPNGRPYYMICERR